MKAIIDTRERNEKDSLNDTLMYALTHNDISSVEEEELYAGDIAMDGVGFERKTVPDFSASMQDGRIESQVQKLSELYEQSYILIDGNMNGTADVFGDMPGKSIRGSMAAVTARDNGVNAVIPCSTTQMLVDMATRLARKHNTERDTPYIPTSELDGSDVPTEMQMYCCVPGVGPKRAETLYEKFKSVQEIMNASTQELKSIDGIGKKQAQKIKSVFR